MPHCFLRWRCLCTWKVLGCQRSYLFELPYRPIRIFDRVIVVHQLCRWAVRRFDRSHDVIVHSILSCWELFIGRIELMRTVSSRQVRAIGRLNRVQYLRRWLVLRHCGPVVSDGVVRGGQVLVGRSVELLVLSIWQV